MKLSDAKKQRLKDFNLRYLGLFLDEILGVCEQPWEILDETPRWEDVSLEDFCTIHKLNESLVMQKFVETKKMEKNIEINGEELSQLLKSSPSDVMLIDVRQRWEFDTCHLPGSILFGESEQKKVMDSMKDVKHVVTICHHGRRSYSAAMFFRSQGLSHVQSLSGGVEEWATNIDKGMPRY